MSLILNPDQSVRLRGVQWQALEQNNASIKVTERMGFKREAQMRWDRVLDSQDGQEKTENGEAIREGGARPAPGTVDRPMVMLAICWDDWENGWREQVARLM
ncbi:hypothetical protein OG21DRAFT_1421625 [Imleria badia]|nr:hypothetical protein OG21DRAFT_1421625 [Imleria badia]